MRPRDQRLEQMRRVRREYEAALVAAELLTTTTLVKAHAVRVYRNTLVHEEAVAAEKLTPSEAERRLLRFFSYMPVKW